MYPGAILVKEGIFLYDGTIPCSVKIFRHNIKYGSGDVEDEPEIKDDLEGEFYYIGYGSTTEFGKIMSGSLVSNSLHEAIAEAEKAMQGKINWN